MSELDDALSCDQSALAAAYVLGALDPDERERYRKHLRECAICRQEVQELRPAVELLSQSVPQTKAPEQLRARVMDVVRREASLLQAAGAQADRPRAAARPRSARRLALALLAVVAAAAVAIGLAVGLSGSPSEKVIAAHVASAAPHGRADVRETGAHAELVVSGMPQPPAGKIYQVWLARPGRQPEPTNALFGVNHAGSGSVAVPGSVHGVAQLLVTAEPYGGSLHPTSTPIIIATLS
jgi:anti-sigma-K factor RskA